MLEGTISYGHFNSSESPKRITTPTLRSFVSFRNTDESVESLFTEFSWDLDFKNGSSFELDANLWYEDLSEFLCFSEDAFVEPGSYTFYGAELDYSMSSARTLSTSISAGANTFFDESQLQFSINPTWNPSRHDYLVLTTV